VYSVGISCTTVPSYRSQYVTELGIIATPKEMSVDINFTAHFS